MKRNCLLLLYFFVFTNLSAQYIRTGRYLPAVRSLNNKVLYLKKNNTFYFSDWSSGSCWIAFDATGNWKVEKDTLYLYVYYPDGLISERKFLVRNKGIFYIDTADKNIYKNWGNFIPEKNPAAGKKIIPSTVYPVKGISSSDLLSKIKGKYSPKPPPLIRYFLVYTYNKNWGTVDRYFLQEVDLKVREEDNRLILEVKNFTHSPAYYGLHYEPIKFDLLEYPLKEIPGRDIMLLLKPQSEEYAFAYFQYGRFYMAFSRSLKDGLKPAW